MGRIIFFALGCFLIITLSNISPATGKEALALISSLSGRVEVQRAHQEGLKAVHLGDQLFEDDVLYTYKKARASLIFSDGAVITLYPETRLALSLKETNTDKRGPLVTSLSKGVLKGLKGIFSTNRKKETLTAVPGIRKKVESEERGVKVLYPRNSMILTSRPPFHWKTKGEGSRFMVSLTLKGMGGKLWTFQTKEREIPYPKGREGLSRGQTYFLRVESEEDVSIYDEAYFMVLDKQKAEEVMGFAKKMKDLRKSNADDHTPTFILAGYYKERGLYHEALKAYEVLGQKEPGRRFVLEGKREIFAKLGLWKRREEINQSLKAMK